MSIVTTLHRYITISFIALLPGALPAAVIHVDDDNSSGTETGTAQYPYSDIQEAIMMASGWDTIQVAMGDYGAIANMGKSLVIIGGFQGAEPSDYDAGMGGDFQGPTMSPEMTVISGGDENIGVELTRFDFAAFSFMLSNVDVRSSKKGIVLDDQVSWPRVSNVTIAGCIVEDNGGVGITTLGAGIFVSGNGHRLLNNIIRNNRGGRGPGICGNFDAGDSLVVEGNRVENNTGYDDHGGGIYLAGHVEIRNNVISGNTLQNSYGWGGGVLILGTAHMSGNVIKGNHAPSYGGAIFVDEGGTLYSDNELIYDNHTALEGAAIAADQGDPGPSYVYLNNCTVANNRSPEGAGLGGNAIFVDVSSFVTARNCIFFGNGGDDFAVAPGSGLNVTWSLSEELLVGEGNFTGDPMFADTAAGDYHLRSTVGRFDPSSQSWVTDATHSPAIDAGDPLSTFANEPAPNGSRVNLGHDGNTPQASLSITTGLAHEVNEPAIAVYPNPARDHLAVIVPSSDGVVDLRIHDILGRLVLRRMLVGNVLIPEISSLTDGTYLLHITTTDGKEHARPFVVEK